MIRAMDKPQAELPAEGIQNRLIGVPDWDAPTQQQLETLVTGNFQATNR